MRSAPGEINTAILSPGTEELVERIPLQAAGLPRRGRRRDLLPVQRAKPSYITGAEIPVNGGQDVY